MAMIDLSLKELLEYQGSSPCPADINEFWDDALKKLDTVGAGVELVASGFKSPVANCYDMYFTGVGNARIHAKLLMPTEASKPLPAIIRFHGYRRDSGNWSDFLSYAASGFVVASLDCRGQSNMSEDNLKTSGETIWGYIVRGLSEGRDNLYYKNVFIDSIQLAGLVMALKQVNENKVAVVGHSQGGALAIVCAALEPKINRVVSTYPYLSDYRRVWELDFEDDAYEQLRHYFRRFDPLHEREEEFFNILSYIDIQNLAGRIKSKVMFLATLRDTICPPSSQFAVYNKIKSEKQLKIYHDFGHEELTGAADLIYQYLLEMQH